MTNKISASFISTVYNGAKHIDRALPSVLSQSRSDFEYVIVNDGSDDNTLQLLQKRADSDARIRLFSPGRLGRPRALNFAVGKCRADIILQQDFDDVSHPDRLKKQLSYLNANPDMGVVGGAFEVVDEVRDERYISFPPREHHEILAAMARYIPFAHTVTAFRKEAFEEAGGYPLLDDIEDLRLWITFAAKGWKLANLEDVLGTHWVYRQSYWHRTFGYRQRQMKLARVQMQAIKELALPRKMMIYPVGRLVYWRLPNVIKRMVRRTISGMQEKDI